MPASNNGFLLKLRNHPTKVLVSSSLKDNTPSFLASDVVAASSVVVSSTTLVTLCTLLLIAFVKVGKVFSTIISSPTNL